MFLSCTAARGCDQTYCGTLAGGRANRTVDEFVDVLASADVGVSVETSSSAVATSQCRQPQLLRV